MKLKYKYVISIFIVGLMFWLFAAWSKITHKSYADVMVNVSFITMGLSGVLALLKILFNKDDKYLNR